MACSLSNVVNNLSEGIHEIKSKYGQNNKKCKTCGTASKVCDWMHKLSRWFNRIKAFMFKLNESTEFWWKVKGTIS